MKMGAVGGKRSVSQEGTERDNIAQYKLPIFIITFYSDNRL
jgi:hypothetical protein